MKSDPDYRISEFQITYANIDIINHTLLVSKSSSMVRQESDRA